MPQKECLIREYNLCTVASNLHCFTRSSNSNQRLTLHTIAARTDVPAGERFTRYAPVYNLSAAAGGWGPEGSPEILGWTEVTDAAVKPGMFLAQVHGKSMEPEVPSGSWCLFRPCPTGSRQGRRLLVQLSTSASPDDGGRYTLKKYHSEKTLAEDGWEHQSIELQPLNSSFPTIVLDANDPDSLRIVGELVTIL